MNIPATEGESVDKSDLPDMKFEEEVKRYNKFHRSVLGTKNTTSTHQEIDLRTYSKYILREGTNEEKRELMGCFKSKIKITKQIATIEVRTPIVATYGRHYHFQQLCTTLHQGSMPLGVPRKAPAF